MLKQLIIVSCSIFVAVAGAETVANWGEPAKLWGKEKMSFRRHAKLSNLHNYYQIDFVQWKARAKSAPRNSFQLYKPTLWGNFSRSVEFLNLKVNGIDAKDIMPKKEYFTEFKRKEITGCSMKLNFGGVKIIIDWYMRDNSPFLFGELYPAPDSIKPIKSVKIKFNAVPSKLRSTLR